MGTMLILQAHLADTAAGPGPGPLADPRALGTTGRGQDTEQWPGMELKGFDGGLDWEAAACLPLEVTVAEIKGGLKFKENVSQHCTTLAKGLLRWGRL